MGEIEKFELPGGIVTVKFVKRPKGLAAGVKDDHIISGGMLEGAVRKFPIPMSRNGSIKNILTKAEKEFYEKEVYEGKSLSVYSSFWDDFFVPVGKLDTVLRLDDPREYLQYKILKGWDSVFAPSLKDFKEHPKPSYQFILEREGEADTITAKSLSETKQAWKNLSKIDEDGEVLSAVIFLMTGKNMSSTKNLTLLNQKVERLVNDKAAEFNKLMKDAEFETKVMLANAERAGIIKKNNGMYSTEDGLPITEKGKPATIDNVVKFFNDPLNNEVKELVMSRLENTKK